MDKYKTKYLDFEEKNLGDAINLIETNNLKKPTLKEQKQFKDAAKRFVKKHTTMKIQIDNFELNKIKEQAKKEGLKYSTLVKNVVHKYITGELVERA